MSAGDAEQLAIRVRRLEQQIRSFADLHASEMGDLVDPFDRLIAGTAARLGLPLLTRDRLIAASSRVRTYW